MRPITARLQVRVLPGVPVSKEQMMYATITTSYRLRDKPVSSFFAYPQFSPEIEKRLILELENAKRDNFELTFKLSKNNP